MRQRRILNSYFKVSLMSLCVILVATQYNKGNVLQPVTVERIIDGDTIEVKDGDNKITVRMIGINTPESVSPIQEENCAEGIAACRFTQDQLPPGKTIYLEYDKQKEDKYGRTLAYIWLANIKEKNDFKKFCEFNFGAILLKNTYCEAVYYEPNGKYKEWYFSLDSN